MRSTSICAIVIGAVLASQVAVAAENNPARGQRIFAACAACHSLEPNRNLTGPSLADLWGRRAGSLSGFTRYSDALKSAGIIWDDQTLNPWLRTRDTSFPATP